MDKIHKLFLLLWVIIFSIFFANKVLAKENEYIIADISSGEIKEVEKCNDFYSAKYLFSYYLNQYDNLIILFDDKILDMEYGIVEFISDDACLLETSYRSNASNNNSVLNGCYGKDAAYLYSSYDGEKIYFMMAGDVGVVSIEDVILHPIETIRVGISKYQNIDGELYHFIKGQLSIEHYAYSLLLDKSPPYFERNCDYYSYDGHYFYKDFKSMIDDYLNSDNVKAINKDNPYYNYYAYLPFRSLTNYDYAEIENYFYDTLLIDGRAQNYSDKNGDLANDIVNKSQYYDSLKSFYEYQNIYGANALMSIAVSIEDSSYGKSYESMLNNSLFVKIAYDNDEERNNDRYESLDKSIYAFDKYYIAKRYSNYRTKNYSGTFLGDRASGIGTNYNSDPYWSEKVVSNFYKLDRNLGHKDYNSYCLGISDKVNIKVYNDEFLTELKYTIQGIKNYSLVILKEYEDSYLVQLDTSEHENGNYDFDTCVGFVDKKSFKYVINKENMHQNRMVEIVFDANGGNINNEELITIKSLYMTTPVVSARKDGFEFVSFDKELEKATVSTSYVAEYREIKKILLSKTFDSEVDKNRIIDLSGSKILVKYADDSSELVDLNSEMISPNIFKEEGKQTIVINYCGVSIEENVVVKDKEKIKQDIRNNIDEIIVKHNKQENIDTQELETLKKKILTNDYDLSFDEIRLLDGLLLNTYRDRVNYRIDDNNFDLSLSGMALSLPQSENSSFIPLSNTYYARISDVNANDIARLEKIARAYDFQAKAFVKLSFYINMQRTALEGAMLVSLKIEDKESNAIYSVYHIDEQGDIVKCNTIQTSEGVEFIAKESGTYCILSKKSINDYSLEYNEENISTSNSDPDNKVLFVNGWVIVAMIILGATCIVVYIKIEDRRRKLWKDYKKSLQKADYVQEEKPKN